MDIDRALFGAEPLPKPEPSARADRLPEPDPAGEVVRKSRLVLGNIRDLRVNYAKQLASLDELESVMLVQAQGIDCKEGIGWGPWDDRLHPRYVCRTWVFRNVHSRPGEDDVLKPGDLAALAFYGCKDKAEMKATRTGQAIMIWMRESVHQPIPRFLRNVVKLKDGTAVRLKYPVPCDITKLRSEADA